MQLTSRDEELLDWLVVVRMADLEALRWAMGGLAGTGQPVVRRLAQRWVARMEQVGLVGRIRPSYLGGSVVWPTHIDGLRAPDLYRQTARHELGVAMVAGRYLAGGYEWSRDRRPVMLQDHQADGIGTKGDRVELVEVELTPKTPGRYRVIMSALAERLDDGVSRVVYVCTPAAARTVAREADRYLISDLRRRLVVVPGVDKHARWVATDDALWADTTTTVPAPHSGTPELFERRFG